MHALPNESVVSAMNGELARAAAGMVLIVDDVPDNLAVLHDALDEAGYTVLVATSGESALQRALQALPDVVLLDAVMPGIDGFEVARRLKAQPETAHIPIVFMTGLTETEHVVAAFGAGGIDYVTKPIRAMEVLARRLLDEYLALGRSTQLPEDIAAWVAMQASARRAGEPARPHGVERGPRRLNLVLHEETGDDEWLVVMRETSDGSTLQAIGAQFRLTTREAEVLYWVVKGKTNRDIGDILGLSPRTVNKHLEHIYEKLGVETRTAAVAAAGLS